MKFNLKNKYKKIYITNDHTGIFLKKHIINYLSKFYDVVDLGTNEFNKSVDYPDYGFELAQIIKQNPDCLGIAICGSGNGINISCNKINSIRSAILFNSKSAIYAKKHNNANGFCRRQRNLQQN
ncbi:MAG: RpiB/LacA/LacB family sugar-phosphate isomerase, partial [Ureaplasma sp.]|nr:RpiB/LacA/LacB family sugar-phosphate isomerase [Ureaplasma sp.]